jgi:hypothetical protein
MGIAFKTQRIDRFYSATFALLLEAQRRGHALAGHRIAA